MQVTRLARSLARALLLVGAVLATACGASGTGPDAAGQDGRARGTEDGATAGRLQARPRRRPRTGPLSAPGVHELAVADGRAALLFVPRAAARSASIPLVVVLHGAGGSARSGLGLLRDLAGDAGVALLAPASRGRTWDVLLGGYGPDVEALDTLLRRVTGALRIDPARLAIGGFSDGASYALSLGLTNGDLFTHVVAFSPGFAAPATRRGRPLVFASHGVEDEVLPIDPTSRRLVPMLRRAGYRVRYREFAGGHAVPAQIAREALGWMRGA